MKNQHIIIFYLLSLSINLFSEDFTQEKDCLFILPDIFKQKVETVIDQIEQNDPSLTYANFDSDRKRN